MGMLCTIFLSFTVSTTIIFWSELSGQCRIWYKNGITVSILQQILHMPTSLCRNLQIIIQHIGENIYHKTNISHHIPPIIVLPIGMVFHLHHLFFGLSYCKFFSIFGQKLHFWSGISQEGVINRESAHLYLFACFMSELQMKLTFSFTDRFILNQTNLPQASPVPESWVTSYIILHNYNIILPINQCVLAAP